MTELGARNVHPPRARITNKIFTHPAPISQRVKARYDVLCENMVHRRGFEPRSPVFKAGRDNHYTTGEPYFRIVRYILLLHVDLLCSFDITGHYSDPN